MAGGAMVAPAGGRRAHPLRLHGVPRRRHRRAPLRLRHQRLRRRHVHGPLPRQVLHFGVPQAAGGGGGGNQYCMFDSQLLTTFTSSIFFSALVASLLAATVTRVTGRKWSMFGGGLTFLAGSVLNAAAESVLMLILGRVLLASASASPARARRCTCRRWRPPGCAGCSTTASTSRSPAGGAGGSASGSPPCRPPSSSPAPSSSTTRPTPSWLLDRGHPEEAERMLRRARGTDDVADEYRDLVEASAASKAAVARPWRDILRRRYRPQLVMAVAIPTCQQLTGIVLQTYAPVLFKTAGFGGGASLMSAVITGLVNFAATFVSVFTVERLGRRALLLQGGLQMLAGMVAMGALMGAELGLGGDGGGDVRVHRGVLVVVGPAGVAGAERGDAAGGAAGGAERHGGGEHADELRGRAGVPTALVPPRVRALLRLRRPARRHDALRRAVPAGDQGGAHRGHGRRLEGALVLEALCRHRRRGRLRRRR
ncbi:hypothetical protein ACP4OV_012889 [Aristida adscensionis]